MGNEHQSVANATVIEWKHAVSPTAILSQNCKQTSLLNRAESVCMCVNRNLPVFNNIDCHAPSWLQSREPIQSDITIINVMNE